jgi:hypothetical protein
MSNDLDALDLSPATLKIKVLYEEETAFHPLERDLSSCFPRYLPCAGQSVQTFEVRIWFRRLLWHDAFSAPRYFFRMRLRYSVSAFDRLVDGRPENVRRTGGVKRALGHQNSGQVLGAIRKPVRAPSRYVTEGKFRS